MADDIEYANIPEDYSGEYANMPEMAHGSEYANIPQFYSGEYANMPETGDSGEYDSMPPSVYGNEYDFMPPPVDGLPDLRTGRDRSPDEYADFDYEALRAQKHVTWGDNEEVTFGEQDKPADLLFHMRDAYDADDLGALLANSDVVQQAREQSEYEDLSQALAQED